MRGAGFWQDVGNGIVHGVGVAANSAVSLAPYVIPLL
jgi:hypothetical protein